MGRLCGPASGAQGQAAHSNSFVAPMPGRLQPPWAVVPRIAATVVGSLVYRNPGRSRHPSPRMAPRTEREAALEHEPPVLLLGNLLRQPYRRTEVPVLAHDDGEFILPLIVLFAGRCKSSKMV